MTHVDVFAHVLPPKFLQQILEIVPTALDQAGWMKHPLLSRYWHTYR